MSRGNSGFRKSGSDIKKTPPTRDNNLDMSNPMKERLPPHPKMALAILLLAIAQPALSEWSLQTGADYTSGEYGASEDTRILYIPLTVKTEGERYFARVTIPYIEVDAPIGGDIIAIGPDGQPIRASAGEREKNEGMGDVVAALGYTVLNRASRAILDVVGKVKFGTADEDKGLGTGENDYSLQVDGYKTFTRLTLLATAGYRFYGDPPDLELDDAFFGSVGSVYKLTSTTSGGLVYDFREKIVPTGDSQREVSGFVTHKIGRDRKVQGYVVGGLSGASPDWGAGVVFTLGL